MWFFFVTWQTDAVLYYLYGPDHVRMNFRLKVNYKANFADQLNDFPQFTFSFMQWSGVRPENLIYIYRTTRIYYQGVALPIVPIHC